MRRWGLAAGLVLAAAMPARAEKIALEVTHAVAAMDSYSARPVVSVTLSEGSAKVFAAFTKAHIGRKIRITAGDKVLATPMIQAAIPGPSLQISGGSDLRAAGALANELAGSRKIEAEAVPQ